MIEFDSMLSLLTFLGAILASFITVKTMTKNNSDDIKELLLNDKDLYTKLNKNIEVVTSIKHSSITLKEVQDMYVSKELFRQLEKHIDTRFEDINKRFDIIDTSIKTLDSSVHTVLTEIRKVANGTV